jgi:hypothetical protein
VVFTCLEKYFPTKLGCAEATGSHEIRGAWDLILGATLNIRAHTNIRGRIIGRPPHSPTTATNTPDPDFSNYLMLKLWVVHEFQRHCLEAVGTLPAACTIYFNPSTFRQGKKKAADLETLELQDCIHYDEGFANHFRQVSFHIYHSDTEPYDRPRRHWC